jgi:hypothetical protein
LLLFFNLSLSISRHFVISFTFYLSCFIFNTSFLSLYVLFFIISYFVVLFSFVPLSFLSYFPSSCSFYVCKCTSFFILFPSLFFHVSFLLFFNYFPSFSFLTSFVPSSIASFSSITTTVIIWVPYAYTRTNLRLSNEKPIDTNRIRISLDNC